MSEEQQERVPKRKQSLSQGPSEQRVKRRMVAPSRPPSTAPGNGSLRRDVDCEDNASNPLQEMSSLELDSSLLSPAGPSYGRGGGAAGTPLPSHRPPVSHHLPTPHASAASSSIPTQAPEGIPNRRPLTLPQASLHEGSPQVNHYGPIYHIATANNVNTGPILGSLTMISANDEVMVELFKRLKVCVMADYLYYPGGSEASLRRCGCIPGTRVSILLAIMHWALDMSSSAERVYWLSGQAGAGKTTISYTIACQLAALLVGGTSSVTLGATFFCSRQFLDTKSASAIIRTIVYQLALRSRGFRNALKEHGRFETVEHGPRSQLMGLLFEPWRLSAAQREADNDPCFVISIEAVDELEGMGGEEFLSTLLDVINEKDLSGLKFLVTSRSEPSLVKHIQSFPNKQMCRLEEVRIEESSADIRVYLTNKLADCATTEQIENLVQEADGLFIHASTVVEYVRGRDVEEQRSLLQRFLACSSPSIRRPSRGATAALDGLYLQILEASLVDPREDKDDDEVFQDALSILHTFLCTIQRTSTSVAVAILNASREGDEGLLDDGTARGVLHRLYAILHSDDGRVMWFHKSFPDFLFDKARSGRFFCNQEEHHRRLSEACFSVMRDELQFNIAKIPSSHQLDCDNPTLSACVDANISMPLRYASGNWSDHLFLTTHGVLDCRAEALERFLQLPVLFWMETMNLLRQRGCCQQMLRRAQQWCQRYKDLAGLASMLVDAAAFATYHSTSKASLSTPHLYLSSLATSARRSTLVQAWRRKFPGIPGFISAQGVGESQVASITVGEPVAGAAVSPDGTHIAVASLHTVRVWDLATGEEARALRGHTSRVWAVAYSPDGGRVVSGSDDDSVRVWDLSTEEEARVLRGHTSSVNAVAYSPDGRHVVSGSDDHSIRLWHTCPQTLHAPCYIRQVNSSHHYTGWLLSPTDSTAHLMFLSPTALLPDDSNILTLPMSAVSHLDFSAAKFGNEWAECYTPTFL